MDDIEKAIAIIKEGGVGVFPTDTLYGLVGSALAPDAVARIYELKQRDAKKPLIVLIAETDDVEQFGVVLSDEMRNQLATYWPGPVSVILPVIDEQFEYLHRGTDTIAFRLPAKESLGDMIRECGPLVAPSANVEGGAPATTVDEAKRYFGTDADFYVDEGALSGPPSKIIAFGEGGMSEVRA